MCELAEKITAINPKMLEWARLISNISIDDAGKRVGAIDKIIAWEKGADFPTYAQLKSLCQLYRKPVAICFFPEPPQIPNLQASCRTLPAEVYKSLSSDVVKMIDEARALQINLYELHDQKNPANFKITDLQLTHSNINVVADKLRTILNVSIEQQKRFTTKEVAFEYWRDQFYNIGIYVFKNAFKDSSISGFCLYDYEFPIIYINNSFSHSRQIFTLFHEIYHIISQTSGIDSFHDDYLSVISNNSNYEIEKKCNSFAGEFLVPNDDFNKLTKNKNVSDDLVFSLANTYLVSREVILRKFLDQGRVTLDEYNNKTQEYNNDYFRIRMKIESNKSQGNYYNTQSSYLGRHYLHVTYSSYYQGKISATQLAGYLNMKLPSIRHLATKKGWGEIR